MPKSKSRQKVPAPSNCNPGFLRRAFDKNPVAMGAATLTLAGVVSTAAFLFASTVVTAVATNWQTIFNTKSSQISTRLTLNQERTAKINESVATNLKDLEAANLAIQVDKTIPEETKLAVSEVTRKLTAKATEQAPHIKESSKSIDDAIKTDDNAAVDIIKVSIIERMTQLQKDWKEELKKNPELEKTLGDPIFWTGLNNDPPPKKGVPS
jgi:hypothetical protein